MITDFNAVNQEMLDKLKPFLSGMSISDCILIAEHLRKDTYEQIQDWFKNSRVISLRMFFENTRFILMEYL